MINDGAYLDHTFVVSSCDMDIWGYLKPTSLLNICQEVAYIHSSQLGFGYDLLAELNAAWVLSRVHAQIERLPAWREQVRVRTWHKRQSGLFALRDYIFYDSQERPIIKVTTSWLIINTQTRRISRVDRIFGSNSELQLLSYNSDALEAEAERIECMGQATPVGEHKVVYSDMDVNQHVNNARYLEWVCDHSPLQISKEHALKDFTLNFNHEAKFGELILLGAWHQNPTCISIEGTCEGRSVFVGRLNYL
ncbi:MAG: thioesterase [Rikenellaceae bacterium]